MKKVTQILEEIFNDLGMNRDEPGPSRLNRNVYLLDDGQIVDTYWFKITRIKPNGTGTEDIIVQCHHSCPTCKHIIQYPDNRIMGLTLCCKERFCNSATCFSDRCFMCDEPACARCAKVHWQQDRRIIVHHDCKDDFVRKLIDPNLSWRMRKLPLAMKINLAGEKNHD